MYLINEMKGLILILLKHMYTVIFHIRKGLLLSTYFKTLSK